MSDPKFEGKVLFVDDDRSFREFYGREAERAGVDDFAVFEDAPGAVAGIKGLDEAAAAIFSDGLNGGWAEVIAAAQEARIPAFVVSGDLRIQREVEEEGAVFIDKGSINLDFVARALGELQQ